MKEYKVIKALLIVIMALYLISCQKDDFTQEKHETTFVLPGQEMPFGAEKLENRTGGNVIVFFDLNGVFANTNSLDSIQTVMNLRHVDSIRYQTYWTSPSITIGGVECWIYNITFYEAGQIVYQRTAFAKFRGISYRQIIGELEGFTSDIRFFHSIRSSNYVNEFDRNCLKNKRNFEYTIRDRMIDNSSQTTVLNIRSNSCIRDEVIYNRNFKP